MTLAFTDVDDNLELLAADIAPSGSRYKVFGGAGNSWFSGINIEDEYNRKLRGLDGIKVYDEMFKSDGQVRAVIKVCELPLLRADWSILTASEDPQDVEIAQIVSDNLFGGMARPWHSVLAHHLTSLRFGLAASEKIWAQPRKSDGLILYKNLAPRLARTLWRWYPNENDELDRVEQRFHRPRPDGTVEYVQVTIPGEKLVLTTIDQEGTNFQGTSILRAAYKHWFYKDQFYRIDAIAGERNGMGVPILTEPENDPRVGQRDAAAQGLASFHAHQKGYMIIPHGYTFELKGVQGTVRDLLPSIEHHDLEIARSVLASFLNLDQGGSYALSKDGSSFFLQAEQAVAELICGVFDKDVIRPLVDLNWDVERYPTLQCSRLDTRDIDEFVGSLAAMFQRGVLTHNNETENSIRRFMGLPELPKDQPERDQLVLPPPPKGETTITPPPATDPAGTATTVEAGSGGQNVEDAAKKDAGAAILSMQSTGSIMVCLVPPEEIADCYTISGGESIDQMHITLAVVDANSLSADWQLDILLQCVKSLASLSAPLYAKISGIGRFYSEPPLDGAEPQDAVYASIDGAGLPQFRETLVDFFDKSGIPIAKNHGFTPHMTIGYADRSSKLDLSALPRGVFPTVFDNVQIWVGDQKIVFPLTGSSAWLSDAQGAPDNHYWRPLRPREKSANLAAAAHVFDTGSARLKEACMPVLQKQIKALLDVAMHAVDDQLPVNIDDVEVPFVDEMATAIESVMRDVFNEGQAVVLGEVKRQAANLSLSDWIQNIGAQASSIASILSAKLKVSFGIETNQQANDGVYDEQNLSDVLTSSGESAIGGSSGAVIQNSWAAGRDDGAQGAGVEYAEYSAILDNNTCAPCEELDGTTVHVDSDEYDSMSPPNPSCEGGDNCRCEWIYGDSAD